MMAKFSVFQLVVLVVVLGWPVAVNGQLSHMMHNWDCVACETNSMLAGNFGHANNFIFNMSDLWWVDTVARSYAAVAMNDILGSREYNGTGENGIVTVSRALKAVNPKLKILWYMSAHRVSDNPFVMDQFRNHPEWWLKNDDGSIAWYRPPAEGQPGRPTLDLSQPAAQQWFANLTLTYFRSHEEAKQLCDGVFVDSASFRNPSAKISAERSQKIFDGKMAALHMAQETFTELNGGEVWGNAVLEAHSIPKTPGVTWNTALQHFNGAFEEMFGSFASQNRDGTWNVTLMERCFESVINASNAGHSVVIHAFPGPSTSPFMDRGTVDNRFHVSSWAGPVRVPNTTEGCQQAAAERLVESLAPFLIVANERVFLSYAWFYSIEDGYIPCKAGVECGMPSSWYPEFTHPLGPPGGPAQRNGTVWTREFQHASVYVDLKDRHASKITWH